MFIVGLRQARRRNFHGKTKVAQTQRKVGLDKDVTRVHVTMNDCRLENVTCSHAYTLNLLHTYLHCSVLIWIQLHNTKTRAFKIHDETGAADATLALSPANIGLTRAVRACQ